MGRSSAPHTGCRVFNDPQLERLAEQTVHRFIVGEDAAPRALTAAEAEDALGDRFAQLLLLGGRFPTDAGDVVAQLQAAAGDGSLAPRFFLLGDGALLPASAAVARPIRFVVACGAGPQGPSVILSAFSPAEGDVELMAWDERRGGFNFYRTVGPRAVWVFAGNSRHALSAPTEGNGPFESHRSGSFLMKELRAPWINWDSPDGHIDAAVMPDALRTHEWFEKREPLGAFTCEQEVARPSVTRWAEARFAELAAAGSIADPTRILTQILDSPAVNLVLSTKRPGAGAGEPIDLPPSFFCDLDAFTGVLGLPVARPSFSVERARYAATLERFNVRLSDGAGFEQPGDTFFAFVVPERAFEDTEVVRKAIEIGLITRRLAACLLMTDFPNPVFSSRRKALLEHVPAGPAATGSDAFTEAFAAAIRAAAAARGEASPEAEFKRRWDVGEEFQATFGAILDGYTQAAQAQLSTQGGVDALFELAEWRRELVRAMPIAEFPLLFAVCDLRPMPHVMAPDGSVIADLDRP
jgi:hypothetical protein